MRKAFNSLNTLLAFLALPLYLSALLAALVSMMASAFPVIATWLPAWLQFIATKAFLAVAMTLFAWFVLVTQVCSKRFGMDLLWLETVSMGDGSGYLLWAGLAVAVFVLWQVR